jgi:hypothetical protein
MGNEAHALGTVTLGAELAVIDHFGQAGHAAFQRFLAVLVVDELGVGQSRTHHPLIALHDR